MERGHRRAAKLERDEVLISKLHFEMNILHCLACGQVLVHIWTEFTDWSGGDDAEYSDRMPLTTEEAAVLTAQGSNVDFKVVEGLAPGRRRLQADTPRGESLRIRWLDGALLIREGS